MNINIKKTNPAAIIPTSGSEYAAGYDLYACIPSQIVIPPHTTIKVGTGIAIEIPEGYFGGIFARSGISSKRGLRPSNCCGVIDSDYRGEIIVALHNDTEDVQTISVMERIAQLIVIPFLPLQFTIVDELSNTVRGEGGFGSSGK